MSVTKYLSNTLFLSILTLIKSEVGFGEIETPDFSFSTLRGTDPGSPTTRVNVEFPPIDARFPPLAF